MNLKDQDSVKEYFYKLGILIIYEMYILKTLMRVKSNFWKLPQLESSYEYYIINRNQMAIYRHSL